MKKAQAETKEKLERIAKKLESNRPKLASAPASDK